MSTPFDWLPNETILEIALHLPLKDLHSFCSTSNRFNKICNDEHFWAEKIVSLGLPRRKHENCPTFKESYFHFLRYLNSSGFCVTIQAWENNLFVFSNLHEAYEFFIKSLMDYSAFQKSEQAITRNVFPPLEHASELISLYQNKLNLDSVEIGLHFFQFGSSSLQNYDLFTVDNIINLDDPQVTIDTTYKQFMPFRFNLPLNVVIYFGYDRFTIYKELNPETLNSMLNDAQQKDEIHNIITIYMMIDTKDQSRITYCYDPEKKTFRFHHEN